jgi:glucosylglycerate synthase
MVETSTTPEQAKERIEQIGTVDLVIAFVDQKAGEHRAGITDVIRQGLAGLSKPARTLIVHRESGDAAASANVPEALEKNELLQWLPYSLPAAELSIGVLQNVFGAYRAIWSIGEKLQAQACAVVISPVDNLTPQWIRELVQPVIERDFDLVAPCYGFHKFEGLLNSAILYPLTRALYGKDLENPLGPDFGFSARLFQNLLRIDPARARGAGAHPVVLVGPAALVGGFKICQAHLGKRGYPPVDWKNLGPILTEILGPLFLGIERDAAFWQRIRHSESLPTYGAALPVIEESIAVDVRPLLEPFRLGLRSLQEIWGLVFPPATQLELKKAASLAPEQFRIPDELWVRIVYDLALAYRLRTIGRDHLLGAMTPLYFGWVASYALEVDGVGAAAVQRRLERLCAAYESGKPYLVSRWRWPDRFNP